MATRAWGVADSGSRFADRDHVRVEAASVNGMADVDTLEALFARFELDLEGGTEIEAAFNRARNLLEASGKRPASRAALVIAADALTAVVLDPGRSVFEARRMADKAALLSNVPAEDARLSVFLHAANNPRLLELPPRMAAEAQLRLLAALAPISEASLWSGGVAADLNCLLSVGETTSTRRVRSVARLTLERDTVVGDRCAIHGVPVLRWQLPCAALVVRTSSEHRARALAFAHETAALLAVILERELLLERNAHRERTLIDASEKRLVRLGFDLHDGPLQAITALTADIRLARSQIGALSSREHQRIFSGRLQDFESRVVEIDRSLRELALSLESKSVLDQPLGDVLNREAESFERRTSITTKTEFSGDFSHLTPTQRLTFFRVLQEALTNVREHSGATAVRVSLESRRNYTELRVVDNGNGFEVMRVLIDAARRGRLGLVGINERVRMLGGAFDVVSQPGASTELIIRLPIWDPLENAREGEPVEVVV